MLGLDRNIIIELKTAILQSRYQAARLVNKELISLYFEMGKKINSTAKNKSWVAKF